MFPNNDNKEGTPPVPAPVQPQEVNQPTYVTKEQFEQAVGQLSQKMDNWYKGIQSVDGKVQDKVRRIEEAAKAMGVTLTPEQRKLAQDNALIQSLDESTATQPAGQVPGQGQPTGNVDPKLAEQVNRAADTMVTAAGIEFYENDPEVAIMEAAIGKSPQEYLAAVQQAITAKQTRTKQPITPPTAPEGTMPKSPGLIPTGAGSPNPLDNMSQDELFKLAKF